MTKCTNSNRQPRLFAAIAAFSFLFAASSLIFAQDSGQFKVGDRVEADLNMSTNPDTEYATWRKATIVKVEMWQGSVAGYHIKTEEGLLIVVAGKYMRPLAGAETKAEGKEAPAQPKDTDAVAAPPAGDQSAGQKPGKFRVGDRVKAHRRC